MTVRGALATSWPLLPVAGIVGLRAISDALGVSIAGIGPNDVLGIALIVYAGVLFVLQPRQLWIALAVAAAAALWAAIGTAEFGVLPWIEWARLMSVLSVAVIVMLAPGRPTARDAALAVELIATIPALVAVVQLVTGTGVVIQGDTRSVGTLAHPNTAGLLFAIALFAAIVRLWGRRTWYDAALGALIAVGLVGTASFGSMAALLAMCLVFVFAYRPVRWRTRAIAVAVLAGVPLAIAVSPLGQQRLAGLGLADGAERGSAVDSISWRFEAWVRLWETSLQAPWFGRGLGATTGGTIVSDNLPHNEYLRSLVEVGWIGTAAIAAMVVVGLVLAIRAARRPEPGWGPAIILGLAAGLLVNAVVANTVLYTVPAYVAALLIAGSIRSVAPREAVP